MKTRVHHDVKDNAGDENVVGREISRELQNCVPLGDFMHTVQLSMKHCVAGDPEIEAINGVFLTNKKPTKSIAAQFRDSQRMRFNFKSEQDLDVINVLGHMDFAPQRVSSKSRPWGRSTLKIRALISPLATEAETGSHSVLSSVRCAELDSGAGQRRI